MTIRPISISTLSPVHVGCDEVYEPTNFVIHSGLLHVLDPADLIGDLSDAERKQLVSLTDARDPIGALQRFFRDRSERFAALAQHQVAVADAIASEYEKNAGKPAQRGASGEATYNLFPMARTAFRPIDNAPYLPGSSLKGSIRTAWLNRANGGKPLSDDERRDKNNAARRLQERLLGYATGKFENDPFRHIALSDAHSEQERSAPPTRVLYAISKKKRMPRDGERGSPELKVFLETIPEALPASFQGELRLTGKIEWNALCDACNDFYKPQLAAELSHDVLGALLDPQWTQLIADALANELGELISARQGFLLRVGRHSGAESVTLNGLRDIKILGPRVDGKQTSDYRPNTTEKRFASLTKSGTNDLLPFGWIWVDASNDEYRHLSDSLLRKLDARSGAMREAHSDRLLRALEVQQQQEARRAAIDAEKRAAEAAASAAAEARAAREAALATMSPNLRRIEEFVTACALRVEQLRGGKERLQGDFHNRARKLAQEALEEAGWTGEEKKALAEAVVEWLPKVVEKIDKDQLKKLRISNLRSQ